MIGIEREWEGDDDENEDEGEEEAKAQGNESLCLSLNFIAFCLRRVSTSFFFYIRFFIIIFI